MRRIALIVLIALLPLQSIWVAAANACQHECTAAGKHFGHHDHEHAGNATSTDDASADPLDDTAGADGGNDSTTHGHGNAAVVPEGHPAVTASRPGFLPCPYERFVADRFLESPLRPPLPHLA